MLGVEGIVKLLVLDIRSLQHDDAGLATHNDERRGDVADSLLDLAGKTAAFLDERTQLGVVVFHRQSARTTSDDEQRTAALGGLIF